MNEIFEIILKFLFPSKCQVCRGICEKVLCDKCRSEIRYLNAVEDDLFCCLPYDGIIKKAIKRLKFRAKTSLAEPLGEMMSRNLPFKDFDCIIPVPLHENRQKERGFNQSELLSVPISKAFNAPVITGVLVRQRETKHQFDLAREERFKNVDGCFLVQTREKINNKNILLVDDIYTTGATVKECLRILYLNGAKKVHIACLSSADSYMV